MDGDTDVASVQQDFATKLRALMHRARRKEEDDSHGPDSPRNREHPNGVEPTNEHQYERAIPNGIAKQVNGISKVGKIPAKNVNGITAQGNCAYC